MTGFRYDAVLPKLLAAYDAAAGERDARGEALPSWKLAERDTFLERLREEGAQRMLEVGAGAGHDSAFFRDAGLTVVATDLSSEMVARCRAKGLEAHQADFLTLPFQAGSFDAVYAMNCLLHVPDADLPGVLAAIADLLVSGGLFYLGVYGGEDAERYAPNDTHVPPRFFASRTDEQIQRFAAERFEIVDFHVVHPGGGHVIDPNTRFQSLTLRRPNAPPGWVAADGDEV